MAQAWIRKYKMAKIKVGINGFGRIGRQVLRTISGRHSDNLEVVAINDTSDVATNAHLFKFDSTYGRYSGSVEVKNGDLIIDKREIKTFSERNPSQIKWRDHDVDLVVECTGIFTDASKAYSHIKGGAKKVIISAPAKNDDLTIVLGVNDSQ